MKAQNTVDGIIKEFWWANDFKNVNYYGHYPDETFKESCKTSGANLLTYFANSIKVLGRGCLLGGLIGAGGCYLSGSDPKQGFTEGIQFGAIAEFITYTVRSGLHAAEANAKAKIWYEEHKGSRDKNWRKDLFI